MMRIHTDPKPVMREYECRFPGCDYTAWLERTNATCPRHRRRLIVVKDASSRG